MDYVPEVFQDDTEESPNKTTPINAAALANINAGIVEGITKAEAAASRGVTTLGALMTPVATRIPDGVTLAPSETAPTYTDIATFAVLDDTTRLRFSSGVPWTNYNGMPIAALNGNADLWTSLCSWSQEFIVAGVDCALHLYSQVQSWYQILVDDQPMGWMQTSATADAYTWETLHFDDAGPHRVRLLASGHIVLIDVSVPGTGQVWAAPHRLQAAIIGDSYIHSSIADSTLGIMDGAGLPNQLALRTGWEIYNLGDPGTGYIAVPDGNGHTYGSAERMAALAALGDLDLILLYGSSNDVAATEADLTAAANACWNAIAAARPGVPIIVVGAEPTTATAFPTASVDATNGWLKAAALANTNVAAFIDQRGAHPWFTGTGSTVEPAGDGNQDLFIGSDQLHPVIAGYVQLSDQLSSALRPLSLTL